MSEVILDTVVEDERWPTAIENIEQVADKVKSAAFSYLRTHEDLAFLSGEKPLRVNLCLSDDDTVHRLNKEFRGQDKPTNVLSFANLDFEDFDAENEPFDEIELGDIIVAYETMVREAAEQEITLYAHFCHLLTHGLLHLSGYDHIEADEAVYMENMEREILQTLDIANPYEGE
ncbi:MAG: rRNA maturation RNase YbeY [Alphaproteobacteria bacterium]|nr:rRNA maturation RNase YbeY [Alphaproteobacteria bacterium]